MKGGISVMVRFIIGLADPLSTLARLCSSVENRGFNGLLDALLPLFAGHLGRLLGTDKLAWRAHTEP